jgi:hypothetical protein
MRACNFGGRRSSEVSRLVFHIRGDRTAEKNWRSDGLRIRIGANVLDVGYAEGSRDGQLLASRLGAPLTTERAFPVTLHPRATLLHTD